MPRTSRQHSDTGVYHVMLRGIDRQDIFADDQDRGKLHQKNRPFFLCINTGALLIVERFFGTLLMKRLIKRQHPQRKNNYYENTIKNNCYNSVGLFSCNDVNKCSLFNIIIK